MTVMIIYISVFSILLTSTYVIDNIAHDKDIVLSDNIRKILKRISKTLFLNTLLYAILALWILSGKQTNDYE